MSGPLRWGGRAALPDGSTVVWSVAEGVRGRRWREAVTIDGELVRSVLLEVSTGGRPSRLEVTAAAGLLTLHPSDDERELHGNVVTPTGIRHLRFEWSPDHELLVVGSPGASAVALGRLGGVVPVGEGTRVAFLRIDDALDPRAVSWLVTRIGPGDWHLQDLESAEERTASLDTDGLPVLPAAATWPLETD